MAQSRNEVRADLINRTECLKGNGKEMIVAGEMSVYFSSLRLAATSAAEAAQADDMLR